MQSEHLLFYDVTRINAQFTQEKIILTSIDCSKTCKFCNCREIVYFFHRFFTEKLQKGASFLLIDVIRDMLNCILLSVDLCIYRICILILYTYYFMYTYFVYKHNREISSPMQVGLHVVLTGNFPEHASRVISTLSTPSQRLRVEN